MTNISIPAFFHICKTDGILVVCTDNAIFAAIQHWQTADNFGPEQAGDGVCPYDSRADDSPGTIVNGAQ